MRQIVAVFGVVGLLFAINAPAHADYYSNPDLRPENRCASIPSGIGDPNDPGGEESIHCQRLFWDLPPVLAVGTKAVAARFYEDPAPQFPRGVTDRPPPMFVGDTNEDGAVDEGFERLEDCEENATVCSRLCENPLMVPYWKELLNPDGSPQTGEGDLEYHDPYEPAEPVSGPLFEVDCQYGSRSYYGPWQTAATVDIDTCVNWLSQPENADKEVNQGPCGNQVFDRLASTQPIRFENTDRLDYFEQQTGERWEWNVGSEYYNHYGSHHGTCSAPSSDCADPNAGYTKADFEEGAENHCWATYSYNSHGVHERSDGERPGCYSGDADPRCRDRQGPGTSGFRNATQIPGRLSVPLPNKDGERRGVVGGEDMIWGCNHHVVTQLPPGSYGVTERFINYRLQKGGVRNDHPDDEIWGTAPGDFYGGAVGEMIIQYFAEPATAPIKPLNISFNAAADAASTYYPPFTWNYHESEWFPPFDTMIALNAIHSHHRMVKGTMNIAPVNPPRPNSSNAICGGTATDPTTDLYTSWDWEDAPVCHYWKETDGAVPIRKGQSLRTTCYVNNGVTPEAIKHGLVAGATVEVLKSLGAEIPNYPEAMGKASTWGDPLRESPVGVELLYGTHPPVNYRVVYKCSHVAEVPGTSVVQAPFGSLSKICTPNPATDENGDYIDGAYWNDEQCGEPGSPGICEPSAIIFACIGEDEMCIGVSMYWAMARLGSASHDEAMHELEQGNYDEVGTPGNLGVETDVSGVCEECEGGPGL